MSSSLEVDDLDFRDDCDELQNERNNARDESARKERESRQITMRAEIDCNSFANDINRFDTII